MSTSRAAPLLPITVPSRAVLWARIQLARSLLAHRAPNRALEVVT
jgi:hypothetical protein